MRGLATLTCIDSRIDALAVFGLHEDDAAMMRNADARVTEDVLGSAVVATSLKRIDRILVMPHTRCVTAQQDETRIDKLIAERHGVDTRSLELRTVEGHVGASRTDVTPIRSLPFLHGGVRVGGALDHIESGPLELIDA